MNEQKSTQNLDEVGKWPEMPPEIPGDWFRRMPLRPGLELILLDFQPQKNVRFSVEVEDSPLEIGCSLSGYVRGCVIHSQGQGRNFNCGPGQTWLSFYPRSVGTIEYLAGQPIRAVCARIAPQLLGAFIDGQRDHIPPYLRGILNGSNENHCNRMGKMTTCMHTLIHEIFNCPYHGFVKRMFLEAKVFELLAYLVAWNTPPEYLPSPCADDEEKIRHAEEILMSDMENPPSLIELALSVGLCTTKLTTGFRQVFGIPVFGYLRKQRLEKARWLIEKEGKTVSEAAWEVGYNSLSSFHRAFVKQYGINGSSCRKDSYKIRNSFLPAPCKSIASI